MTQNSKIIYENKTYTIEEFMEVCGGSSIEETIEIAEILVKRGKAKLATTETPKDKIAKLLEKEEIHNIVNAIEEEEYNYSKAKREEAIENVDLISIELDFRTTTEAMQAQEWINSLGIEDTEIRIKKTIVLHVSNITPQEFNKIARKYNADKVLRNGVELTGKALDSLTGAVNYATTNIVAPTAKLVTKAGMDIGKAVVHTGTKIGAGIVNAGVQTAKDLSVAMSTDTEMLKAKSELKNASDTIMRAFKSKFGGTRGKGIRQV